MCEFSLQITRLLPYTNYSWWWKIFWHVYCISMCQRKNVAHKYKAEWLLWFGSAHEITGREILHHLQSLQSAPGLLHPGFFYWRWKRFAFIRSWWEGSCIYKQLVGRIFCIYERQRKTSRKVCQSAQLQHWYLCNYFWGNTTSWKNKIASYNSIYWCVIQNNPK